MAVFLLNNCKFEGCGLAFPTLGNLIQHIENSHIGNPFKRDVLYRFVVLEIADLV